MRYLIILAGILLIFGCTSETSSTDELAKLKSDYKSLEDRYARLLSDKAEGAPEESCIGELAGCKTELARLKDSYAALGDAYDELNRTYAGLSSRHANLSRQYAELSNRYRDLEYASLDSSARLTKDIPGAPSIAGIEFLLSEEAFVVKYSNVNLSSVTDTKSMHPTITADHTAVFTTKFSPSDLRIGTIIAYNSPSFSIPIMHRIIDISSDSQGTCYVLQGDNNLSPDPDCVRPQEIIGIVIGTVFNANKDSYRYCQEGTIPIVKDGAFSCLPNTLKSGVYVEDQEITSNPLVVFPLCSDKSNGKPYTVITPEKTVYCYDRID